jgi:hypothetical protein
LPEFPNHHSTQAALNRMPSLPADLSAPSRSCFLNFEKAGSIRASDGVPGLGNRGQVSLLGGGCFLIDSDTGNVAIEEISHLFASPGFSSGTRRSSTQWRNNGPSIGAAHQMGPSIINGAIRPLAHRAPRQKRLFATDQKGHIAASTGIHEEVLGIDGHNEAASQTRLSMSHRALLDASWPVAGESCHRPKPSAAKTEQGQGV